MPVLMELYLGHVRPYLSFLQRSFSEIKCSLQSRGYPSDMVGSMLFPSSDSRRFDYLSLAIEPSLVAYSGRENMSHFQLCFFYGRYALGRYGYQNIHRAEKSSPARSYTVLFLQPKLISQSCFPRPIPKLPKVVVSRTFVGPNVDITFPSLFISSSPVPYSAWTATLPSPSEA